MKFIAKVLNLIMLALTFCLMTIGEWGVYNLIALPESTSRIAISSNDTNVSYIDTFRWYGDDLSQSVGFSDGTEPRYYVRSWFGNETWQKSMKWADYAIEAVVGSVTPIFAPVYEVKQLSQYRLNDFNYDFQNDGGYDDSEKFLVIYADSYDGTPQGVGLRYWDGGHDGETKFDAGVIEESVYKPCEFSDDKLSKIGKIRTIDSSNLVDALGNNVSYIEYAGNNYRRVGAWDGTSDDVDKQYTKYSSKWFHEEHNYYNAFEWKAVKYNSARYDKWVTKFFTGTTDAYKTTTGRDENGDMLFKSSIPALYFQFYFAIILSIWFVCQNPIRIRRTADGYDEVSGGLRNPFRTKTDAEREADYQSSKWRHRFGKHHKKDDDDKDGAK